MSEDPGTNSTSPSFISSLKDDVWHGRAYRHSFERWYFDALSDDGREALIIAFYDNYPFSPRYFNRRPEASPNVNSGQFPAVTFLYAVDGEIIMQAVNEWTFDRFSARMDNVTCSIGNSDFSVDKARYGTGYVVHIDVMTSKKGHIEADLEWLSIETDLMAVGTPAEVSPTVWNIVAPRSDVSGRIVLTGGRGKRKNTFNFRGTGYHDHFQSSTFLRDSMASRTWGRAHFLDSTVVFQHIESEGGAESASRIGLVQAGAIIAHEAEFNVIGGTDEGKMAEAEFVSPEFRLNVRHINRIQREFFEERMLSEITLETSDGRKRQTTGIVELCNPKGTHGPLYRWMSDLKIGKNGGPPFF